ncbi:MAG: phosphotransferase [Candidatus Azobacteroides sp.]|nr:phosphotransferase [Candidatus Azobacteroides sp.]
MDKLSNLFEQYTGKIPEKVIPIASSGSNRKYFRLSGNNISLIGIEGTSVEENKAFIALSKHFKEQGLNVPQVVVVSSDNMLYFQEDLGDISLFDSIENGRKTGEFSEREKELLKQTISYLPDVQFKGIKKLDFSVCYPQEAFDQRTIFWDLNYFKYYFLKISGIEFSENRLETDFEKFADMLLQQQTDTFMYRDFQSRNVMLYKKNPFFIDFQGGRKGPVYYDVASFLWQAKANFPEKLRQELLHIYLQKLKKYLPDVDENAFKERLKYFVLFRTLQVLGAYGFRGYIEKKQHFIESIPFALNNLKELLQNDFPEIPYLKGLLVELPNTFLPLPPPKRDSLPNVQSGRALACPPLEGAGGGEFARRSGASVRRNFQLRRIKNKALLCKRASQRLAFSNDVVKDYAEPLNPLKGTLSEQKPKSPLGDLGVTIYSFSYKKGIPEDKSGNGGGYVFDCRAIHNPGQYEEYKNLTGLDQPVIDFLEKDGEILTFLEKIYELADKHIERYLERGFANLMFCFGCTGGQHRSVYAAQHLYEHIIKNYNVKVTVIHREQGFLFENS